MSFKVLGINDAGTPSRFGGDDLDKINNILNGSDLSLDIVIDNEWSFNSSKLVLRDSSGANKIKIATSVEVADWIITIPTLGGNQVPVFEDLNQTLSNKIIDTAQNTISFASETKKGIVELATSIETTAELAVQASDPRLSDARTPLSHVHTADDITSGQFTNADISDLAYSKLTGVPSEFAPSDHATGHITGGGDIIPVATTTATGLLSILSNNVNQFLNGQGGWSVPSLGSISIDALNDADTTTITPVINYVLTWDGTNWVPAAAPGASGGEANTLSNVGTGGISVVASPDKTGTALNVKSIAALSSKVSIVDDATNKNVDIDVVEGQLNIANQTGSIGDSRITDLDYSKLTGVPDASTTAKGVVELATSAEITAGLAVQASDTRLSDARAPTTHNHTVTDLSPTGTALQVVRTNSAGNGVEWASLDSERTGTATGDGDGSTTQFTIAHGLGATPDVHFIQCYSHTIPFTWTIDGTNFTVTFDTAPGSGTNNVLFVWRVVG